MRALQRCAEGRHFLENVIETELDRAQLPPLDRALAQELAYGITRWQDTLDWLIARKTEGREQKAALQILLRLGLYQLFWLDRVPDHAAVNETVELARRLGYGPQSGFLNALLRNYQRERKETEALLADLKTQNPAAGWARPQWLVDRWTQRWGKEDTDKLLEWNNTPPKVFARHNSLAMDATKLIECWRDEDVTYDFRTYDWTGENVMFELKSHPPLASLPSFRQGAFYLQDPSTLLAPRILAPRRSDRILDLCAAPGGKATYLAQLIANEGRIVATDQSPERLKLVHENCQRLKVTCVEIQPLEQAMTSNEKFDRILIDAPCSNTGVMRRRAELRARVQVEEIQRLRATQLELLHQAATRLDPKGVIVYSTCSLEPEENGEVVRQFLAAQPGFQLETERELIPFKDKVDGAYVAKLIKSQ